MKGRPLLEMRLGRLGHREMSGVFEVGEVRRERSLLGHGRRLYATAGRVKALGTRSSRSALGSTA